MRYSTLLSPQRYIKALQAAPAPADFPRTPATDQAVVLDQDAEIAETLIMSLRLTQRGVPRANFAHRFGVDLVDLHRSAIERFTRQGLLEVDAERVRITERGRLLSNMVFRELV